jgi:hypothetical protein
VNSRQIEGHPLSLIEGEIIQKYMNAIWMKLHTSRNESNLSCITEGWNLDTNNNLAGSRKAEKAWCFERSTEFCLLCKKSLIYNKISQIQKSTLVKKLMMLNIESHIS